MSYICGLKPDGYNPCLSRGGTGRPLGAEGTSVQGFVGETSFWVTYLGLSGAVLVLQDGQLCTCPGRMCCPGWLCMCPGLLFSPRKPRGRVPGPVPPLQWALRGGTAMQL